ncbi:YciI family protein [Micromonospora sp. WMMA1363]|uniref:YciI family protein n=1 Tax=Micromonospora sp. WMMA1363 TaxID=3053985 RepID=UPI00259C9FE5|nr:YciI family protein [Micromonospora sp. WMMA1363]MDM4722324.1 YciI family protein [Micromonospora sp. WMMA1363]
MKYLMLIYGNEHIWNSPPADDLRTLIGEVDAFNEALRASGELVERQGLVSRAWSVRMVADTPVVTDGPYLAAKEYVGSYFMVNVDSEERALEIAQSYPALRFGSGPNGGGLEVWPLMTGTDGDR